MFTFFSASLNPRSIILQVLQEDGYISIKRVAALKRVKLYTRDDQVVTQCIRRSDKLELNEDGTMVFSFSSFFEKEPEYPFFMPRVWQSCMPSQDKNCNK